MSVNFVDIVKTVIKYAKRMEKRIALEEQKALHESDNTTNAKEIEDYLWSLDLEDLKNIEALMYLGRERIYGGELPPEMRLEEIRTDLDSDGWESKEVIINEIIKGPLATYLEDGLKIIGAI